MKCKICKNPISDKVWKCCSSECDKKANREAARKRAARKKLQERIKIYEEVRDITDRAEKDRIFKRLSFMQFAPNYKPYRDWMRKRADVLVD